MRPSTNTLRRAAEIFVDEQARERGESWMWRPPLLASAVNDERFAILPRVASPSHRLPGDILPGARSVLAFMLPFRPELANANAVSSSAGKFAHPDWGKALGLTNQMLTDLGSYLARLLEDSGSMARTTAITFKQDKAVLMATWSHKHIAHLSGLGRFGVNRQIITPSGCAGRLGSLVTTADLGDSPLVTDDQLCLQLQGEDCLACVNACPVKALQPEDINRTNCYRRLEVNEKRAIKLGYEVPEISCGKCACGMPCSLQAPVTP